MVLELAGLGALDRPVARVVDAGRELVGEQRTAHVEQLHRQHADVVEVAEQEGDELLAALLEHGVELRGRGAAEPENAALVVVLHQRPARDGAVEPAHREHRKLAVERNVRLQDQRYPAELGPRVVEVGRVVEHALALAVVAAPAGLEHGREPTDVFDRDGQPGRGRRPPRTPECRCRDAGTSSSR